MAKSPNQRLKLLYLMKVLLEETDDAHHIALPDLIQSLARYGISAERKSIYADIEALRQFGLDVEFQKGTDGGYYIANRMFQLPELKLLVDSVQASKFITHRKSLELIRKIESLASIYEARQLHRQVYVANRVKTMNESIYYNVDKLHEAIGAGKKITFRYFEYTVKKEKRYRRNGMRYQISPFALTWDNENYYMLGYDSEAGIMKHYRVDKMEGITVTHESRDGAAQFACLDMAVYSQRVFSMYGGEDTLVRLCFAEHLIGVVMDRFGKDVHVFPSSIGEPSALAKESKKRFRDKENTAEIQAGVPTDEEGTASLPSALQEGKKVKRGTGGWFEINVHVELSPQFYGWLAGFGDEARILSPQKAVDGMRKQLCAALQAYNDP